MARIPFSPPIPKAPYFDHETGGWVVSRHEEVLAVLRSSAVTQSKPPAKERKTSPDAAHEQMRESITGLLARPRLSEWQKAISALASQMVSGLPQDVPIDLVRAFFQPWCMRSALLLGEIADEHESFLSDLVGCLSECDARPDDPDAKAAAKDANKKLDLFFADRHGPAGKSIFLGVAQTVPAFLGNAFFVLLQSLDGWSNLRRAPAEVTGATEELLRYAGPVHTLFRQASEAFDLAGNEIRQGDRLMLRLDSANYDPLQFENPNRLETGRKATGHLSLGAGPHSCVGAALVRICTATATRALVEGFARPKVLTPIEWHCGTMLIWPSSLPILLQEPPDEAD